MVRWASNPNMAKAAGSGSRFREAEAGPSLTCCVKKRDGAVPQRGATTTISVFDRIRSKISTRRATGVWALWQASSNASDGQALRVRVPSCSAREVGRCRDDRDLNPTEEQVHREQHACFGRGGARRPPLSKVSALKTADFVEENSLANLPSSSGATRRPADLTRGVVTRWRRTAVRPRAPCRAWSA